MSWNITHQCRFQSRTGQQYCVNISKQADTGQNIVQLQGSEHPFVTSEANGDDIFMPIRQQTGYLRVLDNSGGTLIDELLPENNTQKMVTLVNLTTGKTEWIGFLAAEVFTQPWGNELTELEFPLKSALACLSDITMQTGAIGTYRLAMLIYGGFTSLFGEGNVPFTELLFMGDTQEVYIQTLTMVNFNRFFRTETIKNNNTEVTVLVGDTYKSAIEAMCKVFGLTLRQQGTTLIFGRYDEGDGFSISTTPMDWKTLVQIYNSTTWPELQPQGQIVTKDLLPIADFRGSSNKLSFVLGGRTAIVTLSVEDADGDVLIEMPQAAIIEGGVRTTQMMDNGEYIEKDNMRITDPYNPLYYYQFFPVVLKDGASNYNFQHVPRGNSDIESFEYREVRVTLTSGRTDINIARTHVLQDTHYDVMAVVYRSLFGSYGNYYSYMQNSIMTGAVPGRWGKGNDVLENCLLLVQDVNTAADTGAETAVAYLIKSANNEEMYANSYINIKFDVPLTVFSAINGFTRHAPSFPIGGEVTYMLNDEGHVVYFPNNASVLGSPVYSMECLLRFDVSDNEQYYWDGYEWHLNEWHVFYIAIEGTSIMTSGMGAPIDNVSGYLARVTSTIAGKTGKVLFAFLNRSLVSPDSRMKIKDPGQEFNENEIEVYSFPYQKIITGLEVSVVYERSVTVGDSDNVYRKTIIDAGFSEDKDINLEIGTNNNNRRSASLLRDYDNDHDITTLEYVKANGTTVSERPEIHLLNRMVEYYKTMRRTMEAKIATGIDLFRNRFSYNGRKYMAIDKKHDWEREEQEVKFIEVT